MGEFSIRSGDNPEKAVDNFPRLGIKWGLIEDKNHPQVENQGNED